MQKGPSEIAFPAQMSLPHPELKGCRKEGISEEQRSLCIQDRSFIQNHKPATNTGLKNTYEYQAPITAKEQQTVGTTRTEEKFQGSSHFLNPRTTAGDLLQEIFTLKTHIVLKLKAFPPLFFFKSLNWSFLSLSGNIYLCPDAPVMVGIVITGTVVL